MIGYEMDLAHSYKYWIKVTVLLFILKWESLSELSFIL